MLRSLMKRARAVAGDWLADAGGAGIQQEGFCLHNVDLDDPCPECGRLGDRPAFADFLDAPEALFESPMQPPVERAYIEQFTDEAEVVRLRRKCLEYFSIIERIERERNQWIEMWRIQAGEHQAAQAILELQNEKFRQFGARAVLSLNGMRKDAGLPPLQGPSEVEGEPDLRVAEAYSKKMLALRAQIEAPIDGLAEREAVDARWPPCEESALSSNPKD